MSQGTNVNKIHVLVLVKCFKCWTRLLNRALACFPFDIFRNLKQLLSVIVHKNRDVFGIELRWSGDPCEAGSSELWEGMGSDIHLARNMRFAVPLGPADGSILTHRQWADTVEAVRTRQMAANKMARSMRLVDIIGGNTVEQMNREVGAYFRGE